VDIRLARHRDDLARHLRVHLADVVMRERPLPTSRIQRRSNVRWIDANDARAVTDYPSFAASVPESAAAARSLARWARK
jgi:hypothetical protein